MDTPTSTNEAIPTIQVTINCTKKVDFLFFHNRNYDINFIAPNINLDTKNISGKELPARLDSIKATINQIPDNMMVNYAYILIHKDTALRESGSCSTAKNAKGVFEQFMRDRLYQNKTQRFSCATKKTY